MSEGINQHKPVILVTMPEGLIRDSFFSPDVKRRMEQAGTLIWNTRHENYTPAELNRLLKDVDICVTGWGTVRLDAAVLTGVNSLKMVIHTGGSVASLVSEELYEKNIIVISGNELYAESVAEGTICYILSALRDIPYYADLMQSGRWRNDHSYNEGLLDQKVGLVGFGAVARYLVPLLKAFRCQIAVLDPFVDDMVLAQAGVLRARTWEELFMDIKVLSLHIPLNPQTTHIIDERILGLIPDGTILVNTARGGIIDEAALARELQKKRFKAILDVYEQEPLPLTSGLIGLDNVILIPHMAGPTVDRRSLIVQALIDDLDRFWRGQPIFYQISPEYAKGMSVK